MEPKISNRQKLTKDQVQRIADLARIEISNEEKKKYTQEMIAILDYIEQLNEANTDNVKPTTHITGLINVTREDKDEKQDAEERKRILDCVPQKEGDYIKVKSILQ